jgi:Prokaryotic cytochrome b561
VKGGRRKTDYGTVILHWFLVAALSVAVLSGLRIGSEAPDRTWINVLDLVLPQATVWVAHIQAAVALVAVTIAYAIYMSLASLGRRVRFDRVRLFGLFGRHQARWGAINVGLYWTFYVTLLSELVTGGLLYFGYANSVVLKIHWIGMSVILGYAVLHVLTQWQLGGASQLLRIVRPAPLMPPPPSFEVADVLALLDEADRVPTAPRHPAQSNQDGDRPIASRQSPPRAAERAVSQRPAPSFAQPPQRGRVTELAAKRGRAGRG